MWYWLRRNTHEPYVRWLHLTGIIFFLHLIMVLILFFVYRDSVSHLTLTITRNIRRTIEFRIAVESVKKPSSSAVASIPAVPKKAAPAPKKATVTPSKKETVKKQVVTPPEKKVPIPKEMPKPVAAPAPVEAPPVEQLAMDINANKDMVLDNGMQDYQELYNAIVAGWSPPPGIPTNATCTITIALDRQGIITAIEIDNSSGMLIYDLAAQAAMNEIHFPRLAWGKSITITFSM